MKITATTTEEFIERSIEVHKNKYDYSKVYYNGCLEKVIIICNEHGKFSLSPHKHLGNRGCPQCSLENKIKKKTLTKEELKKKAKKTVYFSCVDILRTLWGDYNYLDQFF